MELSFIPVQISHIFPNLAGEGNESCRWSGPKQEEEKASEGSEESLGRVNLGRECWNEAEGCPEEGVDKVALRRSP